MTRIICIAQTVWREILRKKDVYVLLVLLVALLMTLISLNIFGLGGLVVYVKDIGLLMIWLFSWILSVNVSSRSLPQEEQKGTIFPLLAKPITRMELIVGKWLGTWTVICVSTLVFYALVSALVLLKGGRASLNITAFVQGYLLHCIGLGIVCAFTILFSTRMNHDATAAISYVLTLATMLVLPRIPAFMMKATGVTAHVFMVMYNLLPHFEFFDMRKRVVHNFGPISWGTFLVVAAYGTLYIALLVLASWLSYRKKRFSRKDLS